MADLSITVPLHLDTSEVAAVEDRIKATQEGAEAALARLRGLDQLLKAATVRLQEIEARYSALQDTIAATDQILISQHRQLRALQDRAQVAPPPITIPYPTRYPIELPVDTAVGFTCACPTCSGWVSTRQAPPPDTVRCAECGCLYHITVTLERAATHA